MADQGLWFKLWATCLTDPDLRNLGLEDFARWCLFGTFMKVHGNNGVLKVLKPALALQENMRCKSYEEVILMLQKFPHCCVREEGKRGTDAIVPLIIEWQNWSKYQGDYSTSRTRKFKERERFKRRGEEKRREEKESISSRGDPRVAELIALFHLKLTEVLREKPSHFNGGSLGRTLKAALQTHSVEDVRGRIEFWFRSTDPFIVANGYSPTLFSSKFSLLKGGPIDGIRTRQSGRSHLGVTPTAGKYAHIDE